LRHRRGRRFDRCDFRDDIDAQHSKDRPLPPFSPQESNRAWHLLKHMLGGAIGAFFCLLWCARSF
jgi:hypothetical protein